MHWGGVAFGGDLSLDADVEARAYGGGLDDPYNHPLLSASATALLADDSRSAEEKLHDLVIRTSFDGTQDGPVVVSLSVEPAERETDTGASSGSVGVAPSSAELPIVGQSVLDAADLAVTGTVSEIDLWVSLDRSTWNPIVSVEQELLIAMIEGRLVTRRDAMQVRYDAITTKTAAGQAALEPVLAQINALGGDVVESSGLTGAARVLINSDRLSELLAVDGLAHVDEVSDEIPAAGYPLGTEVDGVYIDGEELENLQQSTQFYDSGYYGDSDGYIGMTEGGSYPETGNYVRRSHPGLDSALRVDRFENCYDVSGSTCGSNPDPDPGNDHATWVASILLGDVTRGQDLSVPYAGRRKHSGVARRAYGLGDDSNTTSTPAVMTDASRDIHLLNHSAGSPGADCSGTTGVGQAWNGMFEDGIAVIKAAGNYGHSTSSCTITIPGAALGVFTVGAYQINSSDDEIIFPNQSRGGGDYCPGGSCSSDGRTLVDVMGATNHEFAYSNDSTASAQYTTGLTATSGATPTVTGSAALYRDWYLDVAGTAIDSPGVLYATLLLMGDRYAESGSYLDSGFDDLTGAGKLRMRKWDNLDKPARADEGFLCVDDGSSSYISLDADPLDADVDMVK
ncbi:MAG: S8 family serine peptidase, partial [Oligoflexia bacterium]|nr:S8 family serine peptidase [Oligoflexia bacterium]